MDDEILKPGARWRFMPLVILLAGALVVARAVARLGDVRDRFIQGDNDDIMRLLEVRAWLDGQGWFDMMQYRVLPPEGISLHWSRLVDAGIGGMMAGLALVFPPDLAERLTLILWPSLLMVALLAVVGRGTWRVLGPLAASFAMVMVLVWNPLADVTFKVGRIDHHNLQILMVTVMAFAMVWPGRPGLRGMVAGAAAALSLAVGLEMLPLILAVWVMLGLRAAFGREGAEPFLAAFGLTLLGAAPVLVMAQTAPAEWLVAQCDELATPALALIAAGTAASVLPSVLGDRLRSPWGRAGAMLAVAAGGCLLAGPLLLPCAAGPYGALSPEVQQAISDWITEAQPGLLFLESRPYGYAIIMLPALVAVGGSTAIWLRQRREMDPMQADAVAQMLVIGLIGLAGTFAQIRMIHLAVPAVPFLAGFLLSRLAVAWRRRDGRDRRAALALVAALGLVLFVKPVAGVTMDLPRLFRAEAAGLDAGALDNSCRDAESLGELAALPPSVVLTTSNLSVPLLLATDHASVAAPYHRSETAFWNAFFPFRDEAKMKEALRRTPAIAYVAVCRRAAQGKGLDFADALRRGAAPDWLVPVLDEAGALAVYRVDRAALDAEG